RTPNTCVGNTNQNIGTINSYYTTHRKYQNSNSKEISKEKCQDTRDRNIAIAIV
ncbi:35516_t:CDS:1, partial [Racocetra persica]